MKLHKLIILLFLVSVTTFSFGKKVLCPDCTNPRNISDKQWQLHFIANYYQCRNNYHEGTVYDQQSYCVQRIGCHGYFTLYESDPLPPYNRRFVGAQTWCEIPD